MGFELLGSLFLLPVKLSFHFGIFAIDAKGPCPSTDYLLSFSEDFSIRESGEYEWFRINLSVNRFNSVILFPFSGVMQNIISLIMTLLVSIFYTNVS